MNRKMLQIPCYKQGIVNHQHCFKEWTVLIIRKLYPDRYRFDDKSFPVDFIEKDGYDFFVKTKSSPSENISIFLKYRLRYDRHDIPIQHEAQYFDSCSILMA